MSVNAVPVAPSRNGVTIEYTQAAAFVAGFQHFWRTPSLEGFSLLLSPDVTLMQPLAPIMRGLAEGREVFRKLFAWLPNLHGIVDRWSAQDNIIFIEFRLRATIGGRPFEWPVVDRFVLRADGMATERVSYFDPLPLLFASISRPSCWLQLWRSSVLRMVIRCRLPH